MYFQANELVRSRMKNEFVQKYVQKKKCYLKKKKTMQTH